MAEVGVEGGLVERLRVPGALRPRVDRGLAGGLRAWLEDGVAALGVADPTRPRTVAAAAIGRAPMPVGPSSLLRGALVAQLLRLRVAGAIVDDPMEDALLALETSGRDDDLVDAIARLDEDDHARLAAEVTAHHDVLVQRLPVPRARWLPRCGVRARVPLAGGAVILTGVIDLELGAYGGERACVCCVEVTTARLEERHDAVLRTLALLETIRTGEPPLRVAALSTADGEMRVHDVNEGLLGDAVATVLDALATAGVQE